MNNQQTFSGEWETKRLGEIGEISGAGVDKKVNPNEEPVRLVNYLDVYNKTFLYSTDLIHEVSARPDQVRRCAIEKGDIFFTPSSEVPDDIGCSAVTMEDIPDGVYSYHVVRLRLKTDWALHFRAYIFNTKEFLDQASKQCEGSGTRYVISLPKFRAMVVRFPPTIEEQRAIAQVLSDVDGLINALAALITKKRAIKQATMQQLLTGKTRLPGFSGAWETKRLGEIVSFFKGSSLFTKADMSLDGKRRCIHYGELFTTYGEHIFEVLHGTDREEAFFVSVSNDVLMPASDVTPNGLATASCISESDIILGGDILVIRVPSETLNGIFLAYAIKINRNQVMQLVTGTTVYHLYGRDMANFSFAMPSISEQDAIVRVLSDMDAEIAALEKRLDKTRTLKQGMMQQLLTGVVRLVK